jgi:hypothetical protein
MEKTRIIIAILATMLLLFTLFGNYERARIVDWLEGKSPGLKNLVSACLIAALMCLIAWALTPITIKWFFV